MAATIEEFFAAHPLVYTVTSPLFLVLAAAVANFVVKRILIRSVHTFLNRTPIGQDEAFRQNGVIERLANIVPALVVWWGIALVPGLPEPAVSVVRNVANAFIILTLAMGIAGALNIAEALYRRRPRARLRPIKGYVQIVKIAIYAVAAILMIATLVDRSPLILLSGLGAMAAVLILVFQDTLLSLVAGIQISSTDMLRVGDWIEMPALNADGDVIEIALHTVRVQNWDKTITTIPIRKLVTESFRNWRGMQEAGGRRIKRALHLDQAAIRFLTEAEIERLGRFHLLEDYLRRKREELRGWNSRLGASADTAANTRRLTNIGTFRAYVEQYLRRHPQVHQRMTLLVRQLEPDAEGLPLEIYCFTTTTAWAAYEAIQADIFDHLYAVLPEFGLAAFQNPTGTDFRAWRTEGLAATALPAQA